MLRAAIQDHTLPAEAGTPYPALSRCWQIAGIRSARPRSGRRRFFRMQHALQCFQQHDRTERFSQVGFRRQPQVVIRICFLRARLY